MPTCPEGHLSRAADYCDTCGEPITDGNSSAATELIACPACGAPVEDRFCESCGHDSALPPPPRWATAPTAAMPETQADRPAPSGDPGARPAAIWVATIRADRSQYGRMLAQQGPDIGRVEFPAFYPERRIPLRAPNILIGKRSLSQGVDPEIDLSVAPADLAVSRSHAILHLDGAKATITDLGSTNGTCINDSPTPIPAKTPVPLQDGDRIHVGGWTTITLSTEPGVPDITSGTSM